MNARVSKATDTFDEVQGFLDKHDALLWEVNQTGLRKAFDTLVSEMAAGAEAQQRLEDEMRQETVNLAILKRDLRENHMETIATIAKTLIPAHPDVAAALEKISDGVPARRVKTDALTKAAREMSDLARTVAPLFVDRGLPADFVDALREAQAAVSMSAGARAAKRSARTQVTKRLEDMTRQGTDHAIALGKLVRKHARAQAGIIEGWEAARQLPSHHAKALPSGKSRAMARIAASSGSAGEGSARDAGPDVTIEVHQAPRQLTSGGANRGVGFFGRLLGRAS